MCLFAPLLFQGPTEVHRAYVSFTPLFSHIISLHFAGQGLCSDIVPYHFGGVTAGSPKWGGNV